MKKPFARERSIERQSRRALHRVIFYRFLGDILFCPPQAILLAVNVLIERFGGFVRRMELTVFLLETDAARRYKLLTGVDLGMVSGEPARYGLINNPDLADDIQQNWLEQNRGDRQPDG